MRADAICANTLGGLPHTAQRFTPWIRAKPFASEAWQSAPHGIRRKKLGSNQLLLVQHCQIYFDPVTKLAHCVRCRTEGYEGIGEHARERKSCMQMRQPTGPLRWSPPSHPQEFTHEQQLAGRYTIANVDVFSVASIAKCARPCIASVGPVRNVLQSAIGLAGFSHRAGGQPGACPAGGR